MSATLTSSPKLLTPSLGPSNVITRVCDAVSAYYSVIVDSKHPPGSYSQADARRLSAFVVKLRGMPEGVLVLSGLSRVWKRHTRDLILKDSSRNVMGIGNEYNTKRQNPSKTGQNQAQSEKCGKVKNYGGIMPTIIEWSGGPIAPITIQATNFRLKNDMIQQVQNSCQFYGLSGDDANKHLDKFLHVTQRIKMAKMFLGKYFPPSVVTKLKNEITNFRQRPDESLFEAQEHYKLSIDRCLNHNMLPVTQIGTFYNGLTLRHRDTINVAAGGTFMKRLPEECYDLIENMTAHHNDWDTSAQRSESSSSITSSSNMEIAALKPEMAKINKNLMRVLQVNQQVKAVTPSCETCGGPHSFFDCPATVGNTQNANDAILKNMQTNMTSLTNSNLELKNMFGQFMKMNTASSSGSGTLPSNMITNPKEDLKGITTRRGTAYPGPTIPTTSSFSPVVERETGATKDTVNPTSNGSTEDAQPPVVQSESPILTSEPVNSPIIKPVASPISALNPNLRPSIPYPSRMQDQKLHEKANDQREKFFQIFKYLNFNISFVDALILMPKMAECLALAVLGASINLMPLSMWNKLSFPDLSSMCMTLELVNHSISCLVGVAEDVFVKVGTFHFPADFVIVDFDADPRVPLILGRSFLKTERALIDVFEGELTLHVGKEALTFNLDQTSRYSANYNETTANRIDVIDMACEEYSNSDFLLEEVDAFLALEDDPTSPKVDQSYLDTKGDILFLEAFLNDDPSLPPPNQGNYLPEVRKEHEICDNKLQVFIAKDLSVEEKISLITVLKSHKRSVAWKLSDIKGIDPEFCTHKILMEEDFKPTRCMMAIFHDMIEKTIEVFMDDFLVFKNSFQSYLSHLEKMLKRCEDTNLCLNWEKSRFMVKDGIILDHKISKEGIEVDKAKVDVITKLPHPITVKGIRSFLGHAGFYRSPRATSKKSRPIHYAILGQRQEKNFRPIHYANKTMTEAESNYTTTEKEMLAVVYAFEKFWSYLIMNKSIVYTDHFALKYLFAKKDSKERLLRWVLLLQEFTFKVNDTKGAENLVADHLS
nr:hypothetical protein [Tanacetum cinerariifolium]